LEELTVIRKPVAKDMPDSKRQDGAFEPTEGTKEVPICHGTIQIIRAQVQKQSPK
jgi:hypothetical protein